MHYDLPCDIIIIYTDFSSRLCLALIVRLPPQRSCAKKLRGFARRISKIPKNPLHFKVLTTPSLRLRFLLY